MTNSKPSDASLTISTCGGAAPTQPPTAAAHSQLRDDEARRESDPEIQDVAARPVLFTLRHDQVREEQNEYQKAETHHYRRLEIHY